MVNLCDLVSCKNIYVLPTKKFRKNLKEIINKNDINFLLDTLSRKERIERKLLYRKMLRIKNEPNVKINLIFLKELLKIANSNCSLDKIEIDVIATWHGAWSRLTNSIIQPKLPFDFRSEEGARLIASMLCDGGISSEMNPHFTSINKNMKLRFLKNIKTIFGMINNKRADAKYECVHLPKIIGLILTHGFGLNFGRKVETNPGIPEFVFNLDEKLKWAFLSQVVDEEGTIDKYSNRVCILQAVEVSRLKEKQPKLLRDLKRLFESLGVRVVGPVFNSVYFVEGRRRERWMIRIERKEDLQKCYKNMKLILKDKESGLKKIARFSAEDSLEFL